MPDPEQVLLRAQQASIVVTCFGIAASYYFSQQRPTPEILSKRASARAIGWIGALFTVVTSLPYLIKFVGEHFIGILFGI